MSIPFTREQMRSMTDDEIRKAGGTAFYVKNKNGMANRITANFKTGAVMNQPVCENGPIARMTQEEAEKD